jgi:FkbM family methyltransferase
MGIVKRLYRRFRVFRHKPRHWLLRPDTVDRRLFREVVVNNDYRLPPRFAPDDVILDVGAHTGSFALAVLNRGARNVCCCEADRDNFRLLCHNLRPYHDRARLLRGAVWRSDQPAPVRLYLDNPGDPRNTGTIRVAARATGQAVPVLPFDDLLSRVTRRGACRLRLLKLDCEGSEWPILLTSRQLHLVDAVCGEYHLGEDFLRPFSPSGHQEFTPATLEQYLCRQGFQVCTLPSAKHPAVGLFFAGRPA